MFLNPVRIFTRTNQLPRPKWKPRAGLPSSQAVSKVDTKSKPFLLLRLVKIIQRRNVPLASARFRDWSWRAHLAAAEADVRSLLISGAPPGPVISRPGRSAPGRARSPPFSLPSLLFAVSAHPLPPPPPLDSLLRRLRHCSLFVSDSE